MKADTQAEAEQVSELVDEYQQGGASHSVPERLRALRHECLTHRQLGDRAGQQGVVMGL
jgi:hypothetical protein